jgi:sulfur relay (sulfurtransferase) DsrC/TusE family protein
MSVMPVEAATQSQQMAAGEVTSQGEATSDKVSAKIYAELARKEKAFRAKEESYKTQMAEKEQGWLAKEQEYQQKYIPKDRLLQDTLGVLQEAGLSYDQLTQLVMNPPSQEALINMQLQNKIKELESKLDSRFNSFEESQKAAQSKQYEQAINQMRGQVKNLVAQDADTFELINAHGDDALESVVRYVEDYYKETQQVLSIEEAAKAVEEYLFEESQKLLALKKIKSKLVPQEQETPQVQGKPQVHKTLTNTNATTTQRPMTARERAIAAFNGQKF